MKQDTRQAILDAAAPLIHAQGFHRTGLKEILDAAGVPKGSFYFYFKSKEDFGLALIEHFSLRMRELSAPLLSQADLSPLARLRELFEGLCAVMEQGGCERGCPIGNLAQEMSDLSPAMRERLSQAMGNFSRTVRALLDEAAAQGETPPGLDPAQTAAFVVDAWEGAMLRAKTDKSPEALKRFLALVFGRLLA